MHKQGKIWGCTQELFNQNNVCIHRIEAKEGYCCSKHYHDSKFNIFYVEEGELLIEDWQLDYDLKDETILSKGESCLIPPKHYHRFTANKNTIAYEIYYVTLDSRDIIRDDCGQKK